MNVLVGIGCLALVAGLILLRVKTGAEVKVGDLALPALAFGIYLLLTGQITKLEAGGVTIERAFAQETAAAVEGQVSDVAPLPVEPSDVATKGGVDQLERMISERTEALSFRFGHGGYDGPAIERYLAELLSRGAVRWVVFENDDAIFWALAEAADVGRLVREQLGGDWLAAALKEGDRQAISDTLPGLVQAGEALTIRSEKKQALAKMEELDVDFLPVIEPSGRFAGVVEQSRLVASILLEVDRGLK